MPVVTKKDLVNKISLNAGITHDLALSFLHETIDVIKQQLGTGNNIVIRNFGTFTIKETRPKVGRNPNNPQVDVPIPARTIVKFKPGKELRKKVIDLKMDNK